MVYIIFLNNNTISRIVSAKNVIVNNPIKSVEAIAKHKTAMNHR